MTDAPLYYATADQVISIPVAFTGVPSAVALAVTDPHGTATTYTGGQVVSDGGGDYHVLLTLFTGPTPAPAGIFTYMWTGVGGTAVNGMEVVAGTFHVLPLTDIGSGMNTWYCSKEQLKSRLNISPVDDKDDYEIQIVLQAVTDWITNYCGRHFYRITETRTFEPSNVWTLDLDDVVTVTSVDLDYDGDGVYEVHWTEGVNYQLLRYNSNYNVHETGVARPRNYLQVTTGSAANPIGGAWLPWVIPFTRRDRVSVTATWGWADVPPSVNQAALYIAAEMFKSKDSPFGVAGIGELGIVKIQASPWVVELLRPYKSVRKTVGV